MRVRDDDDRQAERGHLGEGRGTGASHDEVSGGEGIEHLVAQERVRSVPLAQLDREPLAPGEGRPVGRLAGDVDDVDALHEPRQRLGDGGVEPPHLLRATEDEQEPGAGRHAEPGPRRLAVDLAGVTDRGPGQVARPATTRAGGPGAGWNPRSPERCARARERDRHEIGEAGRRPDAAARDHIALPEQNRDAERLGREQDRDRNVAAGREDRGRSMTGQVRRRPGDREGEPDRVEQRAERAIDRPERAQREPVERNPGRPDEPGLEPTVATEPGELRRVRSRAERSGDGESRVDVPARAPARDQQAHRSMSHVRRSRARPRGGCRRRRS